MFPVKRLVAYAARLEYPRVLFTAKSTNGVCEVTSCGFVTIGTVETKMDSMASIANLYLFSDYCPLSSVIA